MIYYTNYASPAGLLTIASRSGHIIGLWIEGQKYFAGTIKEPMTNISETARSEMTTVCSETAAISSEADPDCSVLMRAQQWLDRYFAGGKPLPSELPLAPEGSKFRRDVWDILCRIPYGQTITYGEIARQMGHVSALAVGGAVGHNPISIIIPCHRVMGVGGNLTGYAGGIAVKKRLLELEGVDTSGFFIPKKSTAIFN